MKKYLFLYAVAVTALLVYGYGRYRRENRRLTQNQHALAAGIERYRTRLGQEAASVQALRLRWGAPPEALCADGVGPLSRRLTKKQLMRLCEMLGKFAQECEWNVAVGQVLGAVAAEWEDIL